MGAGRPGTTADTQWGDRVGGLTSDLRLCTTAFAFGFVRPDCVLMPRLGVRYRTSRHPPPSSLALFIHTPVAANSSTIFSSSRLRSSRAAYREEGEGEIRAKPRERSGRE